MLRATTYMAVAGGGGETIDRRDTPLIALSTITRSEQRESGAGVTRGERWNEADRPEEEEGRGV